MADVWEYNGRPYELDTAKTWEAGGVLWTYSGRRDGSTGIPLMTPRMPGQGYVIGADRLLSAVIDMAGELLDPGSEASF